MKPALLPVLAWGVLASLKISAQETTKPALPKYQTARELMTGPAAYKAHELYNVPVPQDLVVPAEFEESQAVIISWPYPSSATNSYARLWSKLAGAIQQEAEVWIFIDKASDSSQVKSYMSTNGVTLTNHKFLVKTTDAYWNRDSGPWGFYYSKEDSIGLVDIGYYSSRPQDDAIPSFVASMMKVPNYASRIKMEGGNFMVDGFGHGFYSTRLAQNNANSGIQNPTWTSQQTKDTVKHLFNLSKVTDLTTLVCDGGTGHIDMYVKLLDEQTLVVSEYPSSVTAGDRTTIENNVNLLKTLTSAYDRPFKIYRMPMPSRNDGTFSKTCNDIDSDARGFVNGVFVNKSYIFPIYSNTSAGNVNGDSAAVRLYRQMLPGYTLVPIDARLLTTQGGAIHCITMQVPAENPIRFWHPSVEGMQPLASGYHLLSRITNKSGIQTAVCKWRVMGSSTWNTVPFTDSLGYFTGDIPNQGFTFSDTVEYYLEATSNNGKKMTKPITAPAGYYRFYFDGTTGAGPFAAYDQPYLFHASPNPAYDQTAVKFYLHRQADVEILIRDVLGHTFSLLTQKHIPAGLTEASFDLAFLPAGVYFYSLKVNGEISQTRKLIIR